MSHIVKRFGSAIFAVVAIGSAAVASGFQARSEVPSSRPSAIHQNVIATQGPLTPTQAVMDSELATRSDIAPGTLYAQTYPTDQQKNAPLMRGRSKPLVAFQRPTSSAGRPLLRAKIGQPNLVLSSSPNVTGINSWWTFQSGAIAGLGTYLANIATGNLIVQADDMATPHKGIALVFRRTYNSFSQHDYSNSDGSIASNYGNGWTNTYDAHIASNDLSSSLGITVFDGDGTRYDYSCTGSPCTYIPPAGQFATLVKDVSGNFEWTQKSGVEYWFNPPLSANPGVAGRLLEIVGRNSNTYLKFAYYFDSFPGSSATLNEIKVVPEWAGPPGTATQYVDLKFSNYSNGSGGFNRLLHELFWIDRATYVEYDYGTTCNLGTIDESSNTSGSPAPTIPQWYQYAAGTHILQSANGGRWALSHPGTSPDGGWDQFNYSGNAVTSIQKYGYINPTVTDDSGTNAIQPFSSSYGVTTLYRTVVIVNSTVSPQPTPLPTPMSPPTGSAACTISLSNTIVYDSDGHENWYCFDSSNRVVQTDYSTGSLWLKTSQTWDASNDLTSTTNPRSMEADFAYDLNGNEIAAALPADAGSSRPTTYITYDSHNNVIAECDPVWSDSNHLDWVSTPAPTYSPCPATAPNSPTNPGPTLYSYTTSSSETFGELSTVTKPMGYKTTISYDTGPQGGSVDYGQPSKIVGTQITQYDLTLVTLQTEYYYDQYGNTICSRARGGIDAAPTYSTSIYVFSGTNALLGRVTQQGDPDDASLSNGNANGACPKTPGISGSTITTTYTYFTNGQVQSSQSPVERAGGVSTQYSYDADKDSISLTSHFGSLGTTATTTRFYDADDKLVEVVKPGGWDTRYDYDLSQNATNTNPVTLVGVTTALRAHGALFKVQEYHSGFGWIDMKGAAFDSLGRSVDAYAYAPNVNCTLSHVTTCENASTTARVYDGAAGLGVLDHSTDAIGTKTTYQYRNAGELKSVAYSDTTNGTTFGYDLDGRTTSAADNCTPACLTDVESYSFDRDGNLTQKTESPVNNSDPVVMAYQYYPDGMREALSLSGAINQTNLFTYNYDASGRPKNTKLTYSSTTDNFGFSQTSAGRPSGETDPYSTTTASYDTAAGRLQSMVTPEGTTSFGSYDPEGETLAFTEPNSTTAVSQNFDSVGEMVAQTPPGADANGCALGFTAVGSQGYMTVSGNTWETDPGDCISVSMTGTKDVRNAVQTTEPIQIAGGRFQLYASVSFDADGQLTLGYTDNICCGPTAASYSRSYDADNRLYNQLDGSGHLQMKRIYGPDGHITQLGTTDATHVLHLETLHWDGNAILFTSNEANQADDIKIGTTADYFVHDPTPQAKLTVWDRDSTGHMRGCHNGGGQSSWSKLDAFDANGNPLPGITGCAAPAVYGQPIGQGGALLQVDSDGYWDGFVMIQGVRDYDSTLRGWIEPDPSSGSAWNPMSQKAYSWNNNNPSMFGDPTGSVASGYSAWGPQAAMMQLERADGNCESAFAGNCQTFALSQAGVQFDANGFAYTVDTDYSDYNEKGVLLHETVVSTAYYTIQSGGSSEANSGFYKDWVRYGVHPTEYDKGNFIYFEGANPFYAPPTNMNGDWAGLALTALGMMSKTPATIAAGYAGAIVLGAGDLLIAGSPTRQVVIPSNELSSYMTGH